MAPLTKQDAEEAYGKGQESAADILLIIIAIDETVCLHRLFGLKGAVFGVKKSALSTETGRELKEFYSSF
ncbi:MAG TPA: competence protein TfoX, partial [Methanocorpusculum sp.]|nr:competence protein TfoX [Methanocorpusculum sp.]